MAKKEKKAEAAEVEEKFEGEPKRLRYLVSVFGERDGRAKYEKELEAGKVLFA